jgi:hypothetical protein
MKKPAVYISELKNFYLSINSPHPLLRSDLSHKGRGEIPLTPNGLYFGLKNLYLSPCGRGRCEAAGEGYI